MSDVLFQCFRANKNGSEEVDQTAVELKKIYEPQLSPFTAVKINKTSINLEITRRKLPSWFFRTRLHFIFGILVMPFGALVSVLRSSPP